jgi:hypothetical protein
MVFNPPEVIVTDEPTIAVVEVTTPTLSPPAVNEFVLPKISNSVEVMIPVALKDVVVIIPVIVTPLGKLGAPSSFLFTILSTCTFDILL